MKKHFDLQSTFYTKETIDVSGAKPVPERWLEGKGVDNVCFVGVASGKQFTA